MDGGSHTPADRGTTVDRQRRHAIWYERHARQRLEDGLNGFPQLPETPFPQHGVGFLFPEHGWRREPHVPPVTMLDTKRTQGRNCDSCVR